jgi:hypothetical protein
VESGLDLPTVTPRDPVPPVETMLDQLEEHLAWSGLTHARILQEKEEQAEPEDSEEGERLEDDLLHDHRIDRVRWPVQFLERAAGIEPASSGWKPGALPLSYARERQRPRADEDTRALMLEEVVGVEPTSKSVPS